MNKSTLNLMNSIQGNAYFGGIEGLKNHYKTIKYITACPLGKINNKTHNLPLYHVPDCRMYAIECKNNDMFFIKVRTLPNHITKARYDAPHKHISLHHYAKAVSTYRKCANTIVKVDEVSIYERELLYRCKADKSFILSNIRFTDWAIPDYMRKIDNHEMFEQVYNHYMNVEGLGVRNMDYENKRIKGKVNTIV